LKRVLFLLALAGCLVVSVNAAPKNLPISVNGKILKGSGISQEMSGNRIYVPLRSAAEALGANVKWQPKEHKVHVLFQGNKMEIPVGKKQVTLNGAVKTFEVPAEISGQRIMVPVRLFAELLGCTVDYQGQKGVFITPPDKNPSENKKLETEILWDSKKEKGIEIILKVKNPHQEVVQVTLGSGQDFEIIVLNRSKEKIWQYSDGMFFTQAVRHVSYQAGVEKTFTSIIPNQKRGTYYVEVYYLGISKKSPVNTIEITVE
jgi:hypothetical protein